MISAVYLIQALSLCTCGATWRETEKHDRLTFSCMFVPSCSDDERLSQVILLQNWSGQVKKHPLTSLTCVLLQSGKLSRLLFMSLSLMNLL